MKKPEGWRPEGVKGDRTPTAKRKNFQEPLYVLVIEDLIKSTP